MAEKIHIELIDDLDGSPAAETVSFALDGVTYDIDLNEKNARTLRSVLAGYSEAGRAMTRAAATTGREEQQKHRMRQDNAAHTRTIRQAADAARYPRHPRQQSGGGLRMKTEPTIAAVIAETDCSWRHKESTNAAVPIIAPVEFQQVT